MTYVAFGASGIAAAFLFALGLGKVVAPRSAGSRMWLPRAVSGAAPGIALAVGATEGAVALTALLPAAPRAVQAAMVGGLGLVLSGYGVAAISQTGSCGCSGSHASASTAWKLLRRNVVLFGALLFGAAAGPSGDQLASNAGAYVLAMIAMAYVLFAAAVAAQSWASSRRHFGPAVAAVAAAAVLVAGVAVATAAMHTTSGVYHGLSSSNGGGMGSGLPVAAASSQSGQNRLWAGMYHKRDDGGWNQQCFAGPMRGLASCAGDEGWGSAPCRKYAWTEAIHDYFGRIMPWHGENGASC